MEISEIKRNENNVGELIASLDPQELIFLVSYAMNDLLRKGAHVHQMEMAQEEQTGATVN